MSLPLYDPERTAKEPTPQTTTRRERERTSSPGMSTRGQSRRSAEELQETRDLEDILEEAAEEVVPTHPMKRRSQQRALFTSAAPRSTEGEVDDMTKTTLVLSVFALAAHRTDPDNPSTRAARNSNDADDWEQAILTEVDQLLNATLLPVQSIEADSDTIFSTMQLKRKRSAIDGAITKYKARLCARGDMLKLKASHANDQNSSPTVSP